MVKTKNVTKAEAARRQSQSQKDKRMSSKTMVASRSVRTNPPKKGSSKGGSVTDYAKLVLDPCNGQFCQTNMPGNNGSQQIRCPFRLVTTCPSATTGITGQTGTYNACNTLTALLTPHAMVAGSGPTAFSVIAAGSEAQQINASTVGAPGPYYATGDPVGLSSLSSYVGEMRPVAACIRVTCLGTDTQNSGLFYGYEGAARQFVQHTGDDTTPYVVQGNAQNVIFNGQASGQTYKTYEVKINYPNAPVQWQEWRQLGGTQSSATGVVQSGDASDIDWSEMPVAIVGVTSATPGCPYLFDGAIVYEWQPKISVGLTAPKKVPSDATALQRTAKATQSVASRLGGMLISFAADAASGGSASAALGLLRQGYAAYTNRQSNMPLLLGM